MSAGHELLKLQLDAKQVSLENRVGKLQDLSLTKIGYSQLEFRMKNTMMYVNLHLKALTSLLAQQKKRKNNQTMIDLYTKYLALTKELYTKMEELFKRFGLETMPIV